MLKESVQQHVEPLQGMSADEEEFALGIQQCVADEEESALDIQQCIEKLQKMSADDLVSKISSIVQTIREIANGNVSGVTGCVQHR